MLFASYWPVFHQRPNFALHGGDDDDLVFSHHLRQPGRARLTAVPIRISLLIGFSRCGQQPPQRLKPKSCFAFDGTTKSCPSRTSMRHNRSCETIPLRVAMRYLPRLFSSRVRFPPWPTLQTFSCGPYVLHRWWHAVLFPLTGR